MKSLWEMRVSSEVATALRTPGARSFAEAYVSLAESIAASAPRARLTLCCMSANTDARIDLGSTRALFASRDPEVKRFADLVRERAARGQGGEIKVEWDGGANWLARHEPVRFSLGGTGPQAAWSLAVLGAPAVVALADRSPHMMRQLHHGILLVEDGKLVPAASVTPAGPQRPDNFILEYTFGVSVGGLMPPRSSRIIVRFGDPGLEHDPEFDALTPNLAAEAGAGLVSGFNNVPQEQLSRETGRVFGLARRWRRAGLEHIHMELAGYATIAARDVALEASAGAISSLGMSYSEFLQLRPQAADIAAGLAEIGDRLKLSRVCVHADDWAGSVTLGDPNVERRALMAGCLLASVRAAAGEPVKPEGPPEGATFGAPPQPSSRKVGDWNYVDCPSPFLARPASTLGLGDTFTAGCLFVLGGEHRRTETQTGWRPSMQSADNTESSKKARRHR
jgi:ADP-dependent phosphofructokinase/glucokinase